LSARIRIVYPDGVLEDEPYLLAGIEGSLSEAGHVLEYHLTSPADDDEMVTRVDAADAVLLGHALAPGILTRCPTVKAVSWLGTGLSSAVNLPEAEALGVTVCNVPDYGANAVAEHAIALMLAVARRLTACDALVRAGDWRQPEMIELTGARLGVVGVGSTGRRMIELALGLGMEVAAWTRRSGTARAIPSEVELLSLEELFETSQVISLHVAHTPETERIVSRRLLERMPSGSILINTARSELVDNVALAEMVQTARLAGVGVDVFESEPPSACDPLLGLSNALLTPHCGYNTQPATARLFSTAIDNLIRFAAGTPANVVVTEQR
jgi:phosphoglycerate dehydrogenase-like enzyme